MIDYLGYTRYKFSQETGISEAVLLNIYKYKNKPSYDIIEKLLNKYIVIDANWLLTGKGEMLRKEGAVSSSEPIQENEKKRFNEQEIIDALKKVIDAQNKTIATQEDLIHNLKNKYPDPS